jgi:hypothetical protein
MKEDVETKGAELLSNGADLNRWLGRRDSYGMVASVCSAAEVESLRRIRDDKLYRGISPSWESFCATHLRANRRNIDRTIGYLKEFGPQFFRLTQLLKITPDQYRRIAPQVDEVAVRVNDSSIPLLPDHTEELSAAISEMLRRKTIAAPKASPMEECLKRCQSAAKLLAGISQTLRPEEKLALAEVLMRMRLTAANLGVHIVSW